MFKKPTKEINAEYPAEEKSLHSIQSLIRETCINADLPRKDVAAVTLAMEEGVTNIIRHAYLYEKGMVRIRIIIFRRRIVFSLIDTGRSFQPDGDSKLDLKKLVESGRKGGLGFYMINKIMDSVEYISAPGFNELRMTKLISHQSEKTRLFMGRMFTLRVKFSLYTFAIMLTIIAGSYLFINNRSVKRIYEHLHDTVAALSKTVAAQASGYILNRRSDVEFDDLAFSYLKANQDLTMLVITDTAGLILADSRDIKNLHKKYSEPQEINPSSIGRPQKFVEKGEEFNYMIFYIKSGDRIIGQVHTAYTNKSYVQQINSERQKVIFLTLIGLAIGIGGIYMLSSYFVSPIVRITERVRKFSSGDVETELPLEDVEEYFEISKALNEMMSRLRRDRENIIERERVAKEIEVAGQIQQTLLPRKLPHIPGLKLDAFYRAASRISGDLYDVFRIDDKNYCLLVADVSGKGIPASLMMSVLRTVVRIQAQGKLSSHQIMCDVNRYIREDIPPGIFITILLAIYSCETGLMNFVSAGHNPLLCLRSGMKAPELINPTGIPLGLPLDDENIFANKLAERTIELCHGDRFFIYTDGITDSMDRSGQKYGLERLLGLFGKEVTPTPCFEPKKITELVLNDIDRHAGMAVQNDDITFIVACRSQDKDEFSSKPGPDNETIA
jgi:serine phosphatase RsbU (regulator of sigma subunit)/anti-sigma regulatory factor (Ser/Thr protein kinase)